MGKIYKLKKSSQIIYPATTTEAVVDPHLRVDSSKLIEEINVSKLYPTGGIGGTNKYTLETAIQKIPVAYRNVGIKCSFLNESGEMETWVWKGNIWSNILSWGKVFLLDSKFIQDNSGMNLDKVIKEIYIESDTPISDANVSFVRILPTEDNLLITIEYNGDKKVSIQSSMLKIDTVYSISTGSLTAYIVLSELKEINLSRITAPLRIERITNLIYTPIINRYFLSNMNDRIEDKISKSDVAGELGESRNKIINQQYTSMIIKEYTFFNCWFFSNNSGADINAIFEEIYLEGFNNIQKAALTFLRINSTAKSMLITFNIDGENFTFQKSLIEAGSVYSVNIGSKIMYISLRALSDVEKSGISCELYLNKATNIAFCPKIYSLKIIGLNSDINEALVFSKKFTEVTKDASVNKYIKELYTDDKDSKRLTLHFLQYHSKSRAQIAIYRDGNPFASLYIDNFLPNVVYKLDSNQNNYYVVFNDENSSYSQIIDCPFTEKIITLSKNPIIEQELLSPLIAANNVIKWTDIGGAVGDAVNSIIKELYIPNLTLKYGESCSISRIQATDSIIRFQIKKGDGTNLAFVVKDNLVSYYYDCNPIIEIFDDGEVIGYCILKKSTKASSGVDVKFNQSYVESIDNNPLIKEMLENKMQIILSGDSILGQPSNNPLADMMMGILHCRVINIACGGCMMSLRTPDASNFYDKFSFTPIVESIVIGDFSNQENALSNTPPMDYSLQVKRMKNIDSTKETIFICNYSNNDLTNGSPLGKVWEYTDNVASYNRMNFLEAQTYGAKKLIEKFPLWRIVFLTDSYRYRHNNGDNSQPLVPPYAYQNHKGLTAKEFTDKEIENCKRLGLKCYDFKEFGMRNAFNMDAVTIDGTHHNGVGFYEFAKYLVNICMC